MKNLILGLALTTSFVIVGTTSKAQDQAPKGKTTIVKKDVKVAPSNTLSVPKTVDKIAPSDQKPNILPAKQVGIAPKTETTPKAKAKPKMTKGIAQPVPDSEVKKVIEDSKKDN